MTYQATDPKHPTAYLTDHYRRTHCWYCAGPLNPGQTECPRCTETALSPTDWDRAVAHAQTVRARHAREAADALAAAVAAGPALPAPAVTECNALATEDAIHLLTQARIKVADRQALWGILNRATLRLDRQLAAYLTGKPVSL